MKKQIANLYGEITCVESGEVGYVISISDGSTLLMPGSASISVNKMKAGDRILIDLEKWDAKGATFVATFREEQHVTSFGIGKGVCQLEIAQR